MAALSNRISNAKDLNGRVTVGLMPKGRDYFDSTLRAGAAPGCALQCRRRAPELRNVFHLAILLNHQARVRGRNPVGFIDQFAQPGGRLMGW